MKGWKRCELGDALNLKRGFDLPERDRKNGTIPIVSSSGITGFHNRSMVKGPGVVTGRYGTIGKVFHIINDFWPLNTSLYIDNFKRNSIKFSSYLLQIYLSSNQNAAGAVPGVNRNHLHKIKILLPSLPIQQRIAAILSAYDDLIENNNRRIRILEKMAEELYREWFVRLRFPGHEKVKIVKGVPEGWEVKKLGDIIELAYGKALKEENRNGGKFPVYGSSGIVGLHNHSIAKGPGIIVGRKGNVGKVMWSSSDFFPIDTVYYVKSKYPFEYLFYLIQSMNFINNDAAVPGLNREQAYANKFYFPPDFLIKNFEEMIQPIFKSKENVIQQNELLTVSRERLLTRLMSGKIDVAQLDIQFPPSMKEAEAMADA